MSKFVVLLVGFVLCVFAENDYTDWVSFVNTDVALPDPLWGMFGGYDALSNQTYIIGGIGTSDYSDDGYWYYNYYDWDDDDNWEYSNRILVHDFSTQEVTELGITAAMSFGSLVSSSVMIDDTIYFMTGIECDIDGFSNCKNTTRLHSYNIMSNVFTYDVFGTVPTQDDYDATICWNYNYNNPYIFAFNGINSFHYVHVDEGEWVTWKNTTVPRRGSVCFFDDVYDNIWAYGGYAHPSTIETLSFKPNSTSNYMNNWKLKQFMKADNSYFNRQFARIDNQLFYFFGGMEFENDFYHTHVYYYYYVSGIDTSTNSFFNTYISMNGGYEGLVSMLPIALNNENDDVYLYGGYNGYNGWSKIIKSSEQYADDDYYDGYWDDWGHGHHHKNKNNTANIVVFSIVGIVILVIIGGYCYKYKVKQKRDEVNRVNAITNSLNINSNETVDSKIMFSDNIDQDDTMYGLLNDNMNNDNNNNDNNQQNELNNNDNNNQNIQDDNNDNNDNINVIDKEQLVYMPPNDDNIEPNDVNDTGDTEEDVIEDIHEESE